MFRRTDKVKNIRVWRLWIILLFELIGTALLIFLLVAPSALNLADNTTWYSNVFGDMFVTQALWIAGSILIISLLFGWVSADANPIVTLARVARGQRNGQEAFWIISFQLIGAFAAAFAAYWIGSGHIDTIFGTAGVANTDGTFGSLIPFLQLSGNEMDWFAGSAIADNALTNGGFIVNQGNDVFELWNTSWANAEAYSFYAITILLEGIFTWAFVSALVGSKNEKKNSRPFLAFIVLMIVLTLGVHTNNVALNPLRVIAPSMIATAHGATGYIGYSIIFVAGQLFGLLLVVKGFAKRNVKAGKVSATKSRIFAGSGIEAFKSEVKSSIITIKNELTATKGRYKWALEGNDPIETMGKEDLLAAIKANKADKTLNLEADIKELRNDFALFLALGGDKGFKAAKEEEAKAEKEAEEAAKKATEKPASKKEEKKEDKKSSKKASKKESKKEDKPAKVEKADAKKEAPKKTSKK